MKTTSKRISTWAGAIPLALFAIMVVFIHASADIAPPESPPGAVIQPGSESTQVRMMSEEVILTLISSGDLIGEAKTEATFVMQNLGTADEQMAVRFPLVYGEALYYIDRFHEINDFKVQVDGKPVTTTRITTQGANSGSTIPWASFPVKFPAGVDVTIKATYTTMGFGYDNDPFRQYRYILETGAGWKDTIGSGELIVRLPYAASQQNVGVTSGYGSSQITGAPVFSGNEVRWHFENIEPTSADNFDISLVPLATWKTILVERQNTSTNPQDGEAWGRLGKAIKAAITFPKGYLRDDEGGNQLYAEAVAAYERAVNLLPKDALWHYGYVELLWSHYGYPTSGTRDDAELVRLVKELWLSQQIDPTIPGAKDLLDWISGQIPAAIAKYGDRYDYLILTVIPTPEPASSTPEVATVPPTTPATGTPVPSLTLLPNPPTVTSLPATAQSQPTARNPLCGSALLPLLVGLLWVLGKRH